MRTRMSVAFFMALGLVVFSGCCSGCGRKVWVEKTQELTFTAADLGEVSVETHNGSVVITGAADREQGEATVKIKAGGKTQESAAACMEAIELVSTTEGSKHQLGWKWRTEKQPDWAAQVGFTVEVPQRLGATVRTHNGGVVVRNIAGACDLETHNGGVNVTAGAAPLRAETHNGGIEATTSGESVSLVTHNGGIELNAAACARLGGEVVTHNGGIRVTMSPNTSTELSCSTANGRIQCGVPWKVASMSRNEARGTIGEGGAALKIETYNGGIKIDQAGG